MSVRNDSCMKWLLRQLPALILSALFNFSCELSFAILAYLGTSCCDTATQRLCSRWLLGRFVGFLFIKKVFSSGGTPGGEFFIKESQGCFPLVPDALSPFGFRVAPEAALVFVGFMPAFAAIATASAFIAGFAFLGYSTGLNLMYIFTIVALVGGAIATTPTVGTTVGVVVTARFRRISIVLAALLRLKFLPRLHVILEA